MVVKTITVQIKSKGENDMIDITPQTAAILEANIQNGLITVFVSGSTAAITTIDYEPGLKHDFPAMLSRIAPQTENYEHDNAWHDGNGHSHVRASLIGPSLTIPFKNYDLLLGMWSKYVLLEMDTRPRQRNIVIQIMRE